MIGAGVRPASHKTSGMPLVLPPSDPCSFCEYLSGERPYTILDRDELIALLVTYEQRGRGHLLVVPVQHRRTILELSPQEQGALMAHVVRATRAIVGAFDPEGVAVWQNNGVPAHQSVPHVHVHVAGTLPEGGTDWGEVDKLALAETDEIANKLRPHL
ncbi:HIT family protein [soil metagenome]